jgi:hypothetical protein
MWIKYVPHLDGVRQLTTGMSPNWTFPQAIPSDVPRTIRYLFFCWPDRVRLFLTSGSVTLWIPIFTLLIPVSALRDLNSHGYLLRLQLPRSHGRVRLVCLRAYRFQPSQREQVAC